MRLVFFGTGDFAAKPLRALVENHEVLYVITQPDRAHGRGNTVKPGIVKQIALDSGITVLQPESLHITRTRGIRVQLAKARADVFVSVSYGKILPSGFLNMPRLAAINIHASLLPKYRGASPIHAALLAGDARTGITIMHMDAGLDTGDIISAHRINILPHYNFTQLSDELSTLGADACLDALRMIGRGDAPRTPQDHAQATYAPIITKSDAHIDWTKSSTQIQNMARAYDPWPGAHTFYGSTMLKIWEAHPAAHATGSWPPGTILESERGLIVQTGDGALSVTCLQAPGGRRLSTGDFLRGRKLAPFEVLQ